MDMDQLKAFVWAVDGGSVSVAAKRLFLTQSAVSRRIHALESELECHLVRRQGQGIVLTEMGGRFLPYAKDMLQSVRDAKHSISDKEPPPDTFNVGASPSLATYVLPEVLHRLIELDSDQHPRIILRNTVDSLSDWVKEGKISVAFSRCPIGDYGLVSQHVCDEPTVFVTNRHHPLASEKPIDPSVLADWPFLSSHARSVYWRGIERFLGGLGVKILVGMDMDITDGIKSLLADSCDYVAVLPYSAVKKDLIAGRLVRLALRGITVPPSPTYVTYQYDDKPQPLREKLLTLFQRAISSAEAE